MKNYDIIDTTVKCNDISNTDNDMQGMKDNNNIKETNNINNNNISINNIENNKNEKKINIGYKKGFLEEK